MINFFKEIFEENREDIKEWASLALGLVALAVIFALLKWLF